MNPTIQHLFRARRVLCAPLVAACVSAVLLAGCGPSTLDFRNAELVNGKLYRARSDKPFSGHVTNVPERAVLVRKEYQPFSSTITNVLSALNINLGLWPPSLCDVDADEGILDGAAVCRSGSGQFLAYEMEFDQGVLDGRVRVYYPNAGDKPMAQARYAKGVLDGEMTMWGPATGREILRMQWKKGKPHGKEEIFDDKTGKLVSRVSRRDGVIQGEMVRYAQGTDRLVYRVNSIDGIKDGIEERYDYWSGKLEERQEWRKGKLHGDVVRAKLDSANKTTDELQVIGRYDNGVEVPLNRAPSTAEPEAVQRCVETQTVAFRVQHGEEEVITADQLSEWETECREGKRPG